MGLESLKIVCARDIDFKFKSILHHTPNLKSVDLQVVLVSVE